jgi:hypothetical protein
MEWPIINSILISLFGVLITYIFRGFQSGLNFHIHASEQRLAKAEADIGILREDRERHAQLVGVVNALTERVSVLHDHDREQGANIILMLQKLARIEEALQMEGGLPGWQKRKSPE